MGVVDNDIVGTSLLWLDDDARVVARTNIFLAGGWYGAFGVDDGGAQRGGASFIHPLGGYRRTKSIEELGIKSGANRRKFRLQGAGGSCERGRHKKQKGGGDATIHTHTHTHPNNKEKE